MINYGSIVGSLLFLINTKLNIAHVISVISKYMSETYALHLKVTKIVLGYIKGNVGFCIYYFD